MSRRTTHISFFCLIDLAATGAYLDGLVNDGQTLGGVEHEPRHGERTVSVGHFKRKLRLARVPTE